MTLQELSNLERFVKRNGNKNADPEPPAAEQLLKEEAYLKSRLAFVQQAWARVRTGAGTGTGTGTRKGTGTGLGCRGPELTSGGATWGGGWARQIGG